jgi:4-amino-4-deoxy-L-arabinose transferase-like glycosyltransferase
MTLLTNYLHMSALKIRAKNQEPQPLITFMAPSKPLDNSVLIDIVIPVYNEAMSLLHCIASLESYMQTHLPYHYIITIVDNGSHDETWKIAKSLEAQYNHVKALHMDMKGRGRALKYAWSKSSADILTYMDVDLSTDLAAFEPLIQPLIQGQAVIATGTRLKKASCITRSLKREIVSRGYNYVLRSALHFTTSDAQCGFKAIRADCAVKLLPLIEDNDWFFDTELLARAEHLQLSIHEVAITWQEDPDSSVHIAQTAYDDLKGVHRLRCEFSNRTKREKLTIATILIMTAILYGIGASKNGYANSFYAAAVQAGTHSWKAFFFGSLDASNYITVDKPPVSLWFMEVSTRIFGFHAWSMLLPDVLSGVGTVYLVYASVRRWFGAHGSLLAAGVMALTPVAVLMFGFDNPDAVLTLLLTASTYATIRALEGQHAVRWLIIAAICTGFAFNTKMLQGLIVLPVLVLVYLVAAKPKLLTRIKHLLLAGIFLAISALWWPLIVSAIPASSRPYVGSSTNDSIWNLIVGYNGVGRLLGTSTGQGGSHSGSGIAGSKAPPGIGTIIPSGVSSSLNTTVGRSQTPPSFGAPSTTASGTHPSFAGGGSGPGGTGFGQSTGILRMFNSDFGPNIAWFIPLGILATGLVLWKKRHYSRTDSTRTAFLIWGGYLILHIIVFSMVSGVIHPYYPVVMAPAIAALVGMGVPLLIRSYRKHDTTAFLLPAGIALSSITACILLGYESTWLPWLKWLILVGGLLSSIILLIGIIQPLRKITTYALLLAAAACTIGPTAYAIDTVTVAHTGSIPTAGPSGTGMQNSSNVAASAESSFVRYLLAHEDHAKWLVAVSSANESAPIQISSGQPVMAVGGFSGSDNAMTVSELETLIARGELHYYAVSSGGMGGGGTGGNSSILTWVEAHGTKIDYGGSDYTLYYLQ